MEHEMKIEDLPWAWQPCQEKRGVTCRAIVNTLSTWVQCKGNCDGGRVVHQPAVKSLTLEVEDNCTCELFLLPMLDINPDDPPNWPIPAWSHVPGGAQGVDTTENVQYACMCVVPTSHLIPPPWVVGDLPYTCQLGTRQHRNGVRQVRCEGSDECRTQGDDFDGHLFRHPLVEPWTELEWVAIPKEASDGWVNEEPGYRYVPLCTKRVRSRN